MEQSTCLNHGFFRLKTTRFKMKKTIHQDNFYKKIESNCFFERVTQDDKFFKNINKLSIRKHKKNIFKLLDQNYKISKNTKILEIGCFFGDLLAYLKNKKKCKVFGVEPSKKACKLSTKLYGLNLENKTFYKSKYYKISKSTSAMFDIIIFDDVLSWIDRTLILSTIAVTDWLLADDGIVFIRDFAPSKMFAHPNHHHLKEDIYNFKTKNGHKEFFINSGKYIQIYNKKFYSKKMQKVKIKNKDSMIWSDTILKKTKAFTHPIIKL